MSRKRCPHCGKMIDKKSNKINSKRSCRMSVLSSTKLIRCSHCQNIYGVGASSPYIITRLWIIIAVFVFGVLWNNIFLRLVAIASIFYIFLVPFVKLDNNGKIQQTDADLVCEFEIIEEYKKLRKRKMYFFTTQFDKAPCFWTASPIKIRCIYKKDSVALAFFLYNHSQNYEYMNKDIAKLYDSDMDLVAKIKFK